jgi:hypothetical protein
MGSEDEVEQSVERAGSEVAYKAATPRAMHPPRPSSPLSDAPIKASAGLPRRDTPSVDHSGGRIGLAACSLLILNHQMMRA